MDPFIQALAVVAGALALLSWFVKSLRVGFWMLMGSTVLVFAAIITFAYSLLK